MNVKIERGDIVDNPRASLPPNEHVTLAGNPIIQFAFWGPSTTSIDGGGEAGCNLTSWWTARPRVSGISFTHCEIRFANNYVCSIHEHTLTPSGESVPGSVHCRPRELDTRDYHFKNIPVKSIVHDAMFRLALSFAADRIPFNKSGMYMNFVCPFKWFPVEACGKAFFCSELVVTLMKEGGMRDTDNLHPSTTSPNDLWDHLVMDRCDVCTSFNWNSKAEETLANLKKLPPPPPSSTMGGGGPFVLNDAL